MQDDELKDESEHEEKNLEVDDDEKPVIHDDGTESIEDLAAEEDEEDEVLDFEDTESDER